MIPVDDVFDTDTYIPLETAYLVPLQLRFVGLTPAFQRNDTI